MDTAKVYLDYKLYDFKGLQLQLSLTSKTKLMVRLITGVKAPRFVFSDSISLSVVNLLSVCIQNFESISLV